MLAPGSRGHKFVHDNGLRYPDQGKTLIHEHRKVSNKCILIVDVRRIE